MASRRSPPPSTGVRSFHSDAYRRFVATLVEKRKSADLTQQDVADRLDWPQSIIAKIERCERRVDLIELIEIAAVLGFDPSKLVREIRTDMVERGEIS